MKPLFDAPEGVASCTRRDRSNVPVQALALLNDGSFYTSARGLAAWSWQGGGENRERVDAVFARCLGRRPSEFERTVLLNLLARQRETLVDDIPACRAILGIDDGVAGNGLPDRAAWVLVARAVLNLDEFITRE